MPARSVSGAGFSATLYPELNSVYRADKRLPDRRAGGLAAAIADLVSTVRREGLDQRLEAVYANLFGPSRRRKGPTAPSSNDPSAAAATYAGAYANEYVGLATVTVEATC